MSLPSIFNTFRSHVRLISPYYSINSRLTELIQAQQKRYRYKEYDRRFLIKTGTQKDVSASGERMIPIVAVTTPESDLYPDVNTATKLFDGIMFKDLPICNIRTSKNNTLYNIADADGVTKVYHTCGTEGFKNSRKGSNVAAQSAAITIATKAVKLGIKSVRVKIEGLGPGRMASVKGLQMGGLKIISVTDSTHISWNPPRARKQRRL